MQFLSGRSKQITAANVSAPSTRKAEGENASKKQEIQSLPPRGKKRKATWEAGMEVIDLEYEETEETDDLPVEVIDDDADLS